MDIKLKLRLPFVRCWNKLRDEYGEDFERLNGLHNDNLSFSDFIDHFTNDNEQNVADVTIDSNANSNSKDVRTLMSDMVKPHTKLLAYNKIFYELTKKYGLEVAEDWLRSEWNGALYLHDAPTSSFLPYCFAYDLDQIAERGLFFINAFRTGAPKHLTTFNDHTLEFVSWASNRTSGAVGLPSYLIYSYYFWKKDVESGYFMKDPEYYRRQCFQKFCYDLNQPYLRVTECAFTNITIMDHPYLEELFGGRQYPDGSFVIDSIDEIIEHQKVFMDVVSEVRENTMMTFPVLTYSLLYQDGKFVDEDFAKWCNRHNMKWADANFYVGRDVTSLSSCCRLINDFSKLDGFINSIGGTSLKIGSVKVNTINLRRIAIESKVGRKYSETKFLEVLENRVRLCIQALDVIRGIIKRDIEKGLLPNYTYGLIEIDRQYCTIGIAAMYEAIREFGYIYTDEFNSKSYSEDGIRFASEIMQRINQIKDSYSLGYSINVEAVPAERCAVVLCQKDTLLFGNKYKDSIYSNQWIPLTEKCSLNEKIRLGAILDKMCGGGQIAHINLAGQFQSEQQSWDLLNQIAEAGVLYFAYNLRISVCENEHGFFGDVCPKCGCKKVDSFQRIVGYLVPSRNYSKERKAEYNKRVWFNLNENGIL